NRHVDTQFAQLALQAEPRPGSPGAQVKNLAGAGPPERLSQERREQVEHSGFLREEPAVIADAVANAPGAPGQVGDPDYGHSFHVNTCQKKLPNEERSQAGPVTPECRPGAQPALADATGWPCLAIAVLENMLRSKSPPLATVRLLAPRGWPSSRLL